MRTYTAGVLGGGEADYGGQGQGLCKCKLGHYNSFS